MEQTTADEYPAALARVTRALPEAACTETAEFVPIMIVGEIGINFLDMARFPHAKAVNAAIAKLPATMGKEGHITAVCSASGLTHLGDHVHFDSTSAETLGRRYAYQWLMTEGLLHDLHDFTLSPALLNDAKEQPWYSGVIGMLTCAT